MKKIVKIEIVVLILVALIAGSMVLISEGVLGLFSEPVVLEKTAVPIPQETIAESIPTEPEHTETQQIVPTEPEQEEQSGEETPRVITATHYYVYDVRDAVYLKTLGNVDEKLYPASITKLLSSLVMLKYMEPGENVTVTEDVMLLVQPDSSLAGLMAGDTLTVEQLISAMMLPSGNDAAQVAAVATGRVIAGSQDLDYIDARNVFVKEMNKMARELGMKNSHFENPDGWHHENHYTTMDDLVILCQKVLEVPMILKYTGMPQDVVMMADRNLEWKNTNMLLHEELDTYIPATIGLKTGFTNAAGSCLVSAFFETDRIVLIGVFGCPPYTMDRYLDTVEIYNSI